MQVRLNGSWPTITSAKAYLNGDWRTLINGKAYVSGTWRDIANFAQALSSLTITPNPANYVSDTSGTFSVSPGATPTGGIGPFTYAWSIVTSSGLTGLSLSNAAYATVTFNATVVGGQGSSGTATLSCTATDSLGATATATVAVTLNYRAPIDIGGNQ